MPERNGNGRERRLSDEYYEGYNQAIDDAARQLLRLFESGIIESFDWLKVIARVLSMKGGRNVSRETAAQIQ